MKRFYDMASRRRQLAMGRIERNTKPYLEVTKFDGSYTPENGTIAQMMTFDGRSYVFAYSPNGSGEKKIPDRFLKRAVREVTSIVDQRFKSLTISDENGSLRADYEISHPRCEK